MDVDALVRGMELEITDAVNEVLLPTNDVQSSADVSAMLAEFHATRFRSAGAEPSFDLHGLRAGLLAAVAQASVAIKARTPNSFFGCNIVNSANFNEGHMALIADNAV